MAKAEADSFDAQHPAPERRAVGTPASAAKAAKARPAKRARSSSGAGSDVVEDEEEIQQQQQQEQQEAAAVDEEEPQAKQAKLAKQQRGRAAAPAQPAELSSPGGGLTAMERQRLELMQRNRERMLALDLPGLSAGLLPEQAKKTGPTAAHKGAQPAGC